MVVCLHLHQGMCQLLTESIAAIVTRIETFDACALDHRRVVGVRHYRTLRAELVGVTYHAEQRNVLRHAIDYPIGIEYLVAAVFGIRLCKHHQFDIGRIALQLCEILNQVIDLIC